MTEKPRLLARLRALFRPSEPRISDTLASLLEEARKHKEMDRRRLGCASPGTGHQIDNHHVALMPDGIYIDGEKQ